MTVNDGVKLYEILVPTVRNDGRPFSLRFHRVWDANVRAISGGLTVYPPAKGQWVSPSGVVFTERMIPVRVACTDEQIDRIADLTARYYTQEAVLYYLVSERVVIKHYPQGAAYAPQAEV